MTNDCPNDVNENVNHSYEDEGKKENASDNGQEDMDVEINDDEPEFFKQFSPEQKVKNAVQY